MNFSQLDMIRAVKEKGSISAAADTVGFSQSAASRALSTLEAELGVVLVKRSRNGGVLTAVGEELLPHIYVILAQAEQIRQAAAARQGLSGGKLRIGSSPGMPARLLSRLMGAFRQRYPGVQTVVFEGEDAEILAWLSQGIVEVGLVAQMDAASNVIPIARDELQLIVAENHRFAHRSRIQIGDLAHEAFVMPKFACSNLVRRLSQEAGIALDLQLELSDVNTVLAMVKEGLGVSLMPQMNIPEPLAHMRVLSFDPPQYRYIRAVVSSLQSASPASRAFIELARDCGGYAEQQPLPVRLIESDQLLALGQPVR